MFVKVCGMRTERDMDLAVELGYTAAGVVLHPASTRYVNRELARDLAKYASGRILRVAVGLTREEVSCVADVFDIVQTYEACNGMRHILAGGKPHLNGSHEYYLYDRSMGDGVFTEPAVFPEEIRSRLILAGGLNPSNVRAVVEKYRPFGIDVSSGVERDRGIKDPDLMKRFITEVRNACC